MHIDLNTIWFILVGVLFTGYAVLDGFDLGIGALHLFTKDDTERRILINSIGPVWDGNEVWLVTGGGALFAAFPNVYATVFSGFYLALMLLLASLIFRAVAIEFRSKQPMRWWRQMWDIGFAGGSIVSALLIGTALGNIAWGVPVNARGEFAGTFLGLLTPYPLLVGVTTVALFMMHGAIYGVMKTEGALHDKLRVWAMRCIIFFVICAVTLTMATLLYVPHMSERVRDTSAALHRRAGEHAGHRQHPARIPPRQRRQGISVLVRRDGDADGAVRAEHFSKPGLQPAQSR